MTLDLAAAVTARNFSVELNVAAGETVAVLGPNGAGKSTLLNLVAGLLRPDTGHVQLAGRTLAGRTLADPAAHVWVPPHERGVSLLAQQPLLFPHLSVLDNVAFGPRSAGKSSRDARAIARIWLEEVDALELAERRPASLSGGQAQRIGVARALASDPQLLLLDEPFAALDVAVAPALRRMLRRVLESRTVVVVTHDVLDAFTLADRVVVMHDGAIVEQGPTREVLLHPRTRFTAELAALNLLMGTRVDGGMSMGGGTGFEGRVIAAAVAHSAAGAAFPIGAAAAMAVRPSAVSVSVAEHASAERASAEHASADPTSTEQASADRSAGLNVLRGIVHDLEPRGDVVRVRGVVGGSGVVSGLGALGGAEGAGQALAADVLPSVVVDLDLSPGAAVFFSFEPGAATMYPSA
nr:ATP-binding cassette domain-containing protein [Glaciihabitans tibetensis]